MITLRSVKGSELSHEEMDGNLTTLYQLTEEAKNLANLAITQESADTRYIRSVNGVAPDAAGNVTLPTPSLSGPEFVEAVSDALGSIDFAPTVPPVTVTTPADFFVSGNVLTDATTITGSLKVINYSVPTISVPTGITYTAGVSSTTSPLGTFRLNQDGSWTLTPKLYTAGVQSAVKYTVSNGLTTSQGTLVFNLVWHNHAPVTNPDNVTVVEDTAVQVNVLANDVEWDGHLMTVTHIHSTPVTPGGAAVAVPNGTASLAANGATITFTPTTGYAGLASFNYTVQDSYSGASGPLTSIGVVNVLVTNPSNLATSNYTTGKSVLVPFNFSANMLQKNQTVQEPTTGATVKRITDVTQDFPGQVALYNAYSRYPTENATEEYCLAFAGNSTSCLVIDRSSGSVVASLAYDNTGLPSHSVGAYHEVRWHYTLAHPYRVYFVRGQQFWMINDVRDQANTRALVKDFATVIDWTGTPEGALRKVYMDQEGNSSLDSDHWAWMAAYYSSTSGVWVVRAYVHYQISTDTVDVMYPADIQQFARAPGNEETLVTFRHRPNAVEMVPDGSGIVIHSERAYGGNKDEYIGTIFEAPYIFPRDFNPATLTPFRIASDATHSGWSTVAGVWHYVSQDNRRDTWCAVPIAGPLKGYGNEGYLDVTGPALGDGVIDFYLDNDGFYPGMHFGVCTNAADGWTLVSTYATQTAASYGMANADFMMQIKPAAEAVYWKISPSFNQYPASEKQDWNESPGSINLAGTRLYTCGDWNGTLAITPDGKGRYCDLFTVDLPPNWANQFEPELPASLTAPSVTGSAEQGQTLTRVSGTWSGFPTPTLTGIWQRDGVDVSGATGATYLIGASDISSRLRYKEIGTNPSGSAFAYSAETDVVVGLPLPEIVTAPAISGLAQEGQSISVTDGTWTNSPTAFVRKLYRGATQVSGVSGANYTLGVVDVGQQMRWGIVASNSYGPSPEVFSAFTAAVAADPGSVYRLAAVVSNSASPSTNTLTRSAPEFDAEAGALIVVSVDWNTNGGTNTGVSVSDTAGNTYTAGPVVSHAGLNGRVQQFWCLSSAAQLANVVTATNAALSTPLNVSVQQYGAATGTTWTRTAQASASTDYVVNPVSTSAFDMAANSVAVGHWFDLYGLNGTVQAGDTLVHAVQGTSWTLERVRGQAASAMIMTSSCTGNSYTRMAASVQVFTRT